MFRDYRGGNDNEDKFIGESCATDSADLQNHNLEFKAIKNITTN